ncbi:MAG: hypothetical protein SNJ82_00805 [Gemmataceae bacterium]
MSRLIPVLGIVLLSMGCWGKQTRPNVPDPFLGDYPGTPPAQGQPARPAKEFTGKPEDPPTTSTTSTAEITNPAVKLGNPRPSEIKTNKDRQLDRLPGIGAPEDCSVATSNRLMPAPGGRGLTTVSNEQVAPPASATLTYEALQKRLQERGVTWQQLQHLGNDRWHFICAIVDPDSPGYRENFEVIREGNHGLNALQAVLEQIEKRQQGAASPQAIYGGPRSDN